MKSLVALLLILFSFNTALADKPENDIVLTIDASKKAGKLPYLFRGGVFNGNVIPKGYFLEKFLKDIKPGAFEFYLAHTTIRPSTSLRDLTYRLREWDDAARKVSARGGEIVIAIDAMPRWLTSNKSKSPVNKAIGDYTPVGNLSPPKDYNKWAEMVGAIVDHFNNKLGVKAKYIIWGEPDIGWWQGTEQEYFKLYKYAVLGAKRADRDAKVGGPAVSHWKKTKKKGSDPLLYNFIKYASETELPEMGLKRLPIDFINWHQFNANPLDPLSYSIPADAIRQWLDKFGYSKDTEFLVGEWIIWQYFGKKHGFSNEEHDTEVNASFIISSLIAMDEAGIQRHSYAYLIDSVQGEEYVGDFGLFTKKGLIKASFNAFKAVSMMEGERLFVDNEDHTIRAIASYDEGKFYILISNFVPYGNMLNSIFAQRGYSKKDIKRYKIGKEDLKRILDGTAKVDRLDVSSEEKKKLKDVMSILREYREREKSPLSVKLRVLADKDRPYLYERYVIDSRNSNSYSHRDRIRSLRKKKLGNINEMDGVRLEMAEKRTLTSLASFEPISLTPYSVTLIVLTPK